MKKLIALLAFLIPLVAAAVPAPIAPPTTATETLGTTLRRAYTLNIDNNPTVNPPLIAPQLWAASTAYLIGTVVNSSGHLYVESATSCTSSSTAPTNLFANNLSDGGSPACYWIYMGEPKITVNDANAPTVTTTSTNPPFTTSVVYYPVGYPNAFKLFTGSPITTLTNYWNLQTANYKSGSANYGGLVCYKVTDSKFGIALQSGGNRPIVTVNNRLLSEQQLYPTVSGNPNWLVLDFSAVGINSRQERTVCQYSSSFNGVAVTPSGIVKPDTTPRIPVAMIADSYDQGSGYGPFSAYGRYSLQLGWNMGWAVTPLSQLGTGPVSTSTSTICTTAPLCYNYLQVFGDTFNQAVVAAAKVIVIYGSTNDVGTASATETAQVTAILTQARAFNPTALIIWIGPSSINYSSQFTNLQALDTAVAAGVAAFAATDPQGVSGTCYIPFANDPNPIFNGSYVTTVPTNAATGAQFINSGDNIHPVDIGTRVLARWTAETIYNNCIAGLK